MDDIDSVMAVLAAAALAACGPLPDVCEPQTVLLRDVARPLVLLELAPADATVHVEAEDLMEQTAASADWPLQAVDGGWVFTDAWCGLGVCFVSADIPPRCTGSRYHITFTLADLTPVALEGDSNFDEELCFWGAENCFEVEIVTTAIR
jgi:hypothetical protein